MSPELVKILEQMGLYETMTQEDLASRFSHSDGVVVRYGIYVLVAARYHTTNGDRFFGVVYKAQDGESTRITSPNVRTEASEFLLKDEGHAIEWCLKYCK